MSIHRAKSAEEYIDLVQQAIFEIEELYMAAEYDMEDMGGIHRFVDELDREVRALYRAMSEGSYRFADEDLPFMEVAERAADDALPFKYLLRVINETHRRGLDVGED